MPLNAAPPTGATVKMRYAIDEVGYPGMTPDAPIFMSAFDTGSRNIRETRQTVEDPNAYGEVCEISVADGGEGTHPYTFSFCANRPTVEAVMGAKQTFAPRSTAVANCVAATKKFSSSAVDYYKAGFRPGMIVKVTGASGGNAAQFNGWKLITAVSAAGSSPSEITFFADGSTRYPTPTADLSTQTLTIDAGYITPQGAEAPNVIIERSFDDVLNPSQVAGLYQNVRGAIFQNFSETFEPGAFVSGTLESRASQWSGTNTSPIALLAAAPDCACGDKVMFDPDNTPVEVFYAGELLCVTRGEISFSRPVNVQKNSCGRQTTTGKAKPSLSLTVPFTSSLFNERVASRFTGPLTLVIWNADRSHFETRYWPAASPTLEQVDPDDENAIVQQVTFSTANAADAINRSAMLVQRSFLSLAPPRNRFECTFTVVVGTDAPKQLVITGGAVGETVTVDWGDGTIATFTRATTGAETYSRTYAASGTYRVKAWSNSATPWTIIAASGAGDVMSLPEFRYLRPYLTSFTAQVADTKIEMKNMIALTAVNITSAAMTFLDITGSRPLTVNLANATAISTACVDHILAELVKGGLNGGTCDLTGGSNAPSAAGTANAGILTARGWTVTVN